MRGIIPVALAAAATISVGFLSAGTADTTPALTAQLIEARRNSLRKEAAVEVRVTGLELVDPASTGEKPKPGEGNLHYQLDSGPVIATTARKLSFQKLTPGKHLIKVALAANDHLPLGPAQELEVVIP